MLASQTSRFFSFLQSCEVQFMCRLRWALPIHFSMIGLGLYPLLPLLYFGWTPLHERVIIFTWNIEKKNQGVGRRRACVYLHGNEGRRRNTRFVYFTKLESEGQTVDAKLHKTLCIEGKNGGKVEEPVTVQVDNNQSFITRSSSRRRKKVGP